MEPRVNLFENEVILKYVKRLGAANRPIEESSLPHATQDLVKLRASQINGCGFCTDMHSKDAAKAGETSVRLNLVAAWREANVFTEAERAALALAEEGTRIADAHHGVSDDTWAQVREHYDDEQIGALIALIAAINAYNRLNVIARTPAGDYQPGMFD
ncbi:carboxymuconolactone decarboxylase family protein [Amycolatopsis keratiniphila]|uniref:Alkylhydroperoxidase n=1 Tax=Amycolatopsis keratiniphila subsp. keratiniphila TaxID=227715 RepID=A0A1W2LWF1_9PSEU|nr:carboxymuconolactone decarboxylase family protein [Amycolatopsis keratiniphila]OLZ57874.1 alkylhydroperoxidase [Amycolatopsis keratiniphila subsp. nogabecina]ONF70872.1 alkylhydroperoxidase [Amycolatopsis keratiniphila subsp. keratiniphila]SDU03755.1 alkylhydroperoxidase AhpD family core domain-containing protein [Amycolatopsis keratiniphila]